MKTGGVPVVALDLAQTLDSKRFQLHLVTQDDGPFYAKFSAIIPCTTLPLRGFHPRSLLAIRTILRSGQFDIVHSHGRGAGLYARLAACGLPTRTLHAFHGLNMRYRPAVWRFANLAMERSLTPFTDAFICVSEGEREEALAARVAPPERIHVIHNGVGSFRPASILSERICDGPVIGTLSRISIQKGLEHLLPAIAILRREHPGIRCLIAGGVQPEERPRLKTLLSLVESLGLSGRVEFLGEVPSAADFFPRINIYVSASLWEGLPTAILEAFAAGVPTIATDVVGNRDLVRDGETGLLAKPADPASLAAALHQALSDTEAARERAARARRHVTENFSVHKMALLYSRLYEKISGAITSR